MISIRLKHVVAMLAFVAMPVLLSACGGQEEPKTQVNAPEVVDQAKEAKAETPPAPPAVVVPAPVSETPVEAIDAPAVEDKPAEEVPAEKVPAEEMPAEEAPAEETKSADAVPELLSANDEVLIFFPSIHLEDSMEMILRNFVQENYINLVLTYMGEADALMEEFKGNIHVEYCKNSRTEAIVVASAVNRNENYGIIILGKEGKVFSYMLPNPSGNVKTPEDFPPLSANFPMDKISPEFMAFIEALKDCGFEGE